MHPIAILNATNAQRNGSFAHYSRRVRLGKLGIASVDAIDMIERRAAEKAARRFLDRSYKRLGLDRAEQYAEIATDMEAVKTDGVWARSSKEYALRCRSLDTAVLDAVADLNRMPHEDPYYLQFRRKAA